MLHVIKAGDMLFRFDLVLVQQVAFLNEVKRFIGLDHQLLVGFSQVLGLDGDNLLLLELDVTACGNDDSVLAWIMSCVIPALCQLFLQFKVLDCLLLELCEIEGVFLVR